MIAQRLRILSFAVSPLPSPVEPAAPRQPNCFLVRALYLSYNRSSVHLGFVDTGDAFEKQEGGAHAAVRLSGPPTLRIIEFFYREIVEPKERDR